ncbi:hypothetical protein [Amycolatopsis speibonae]|uniref:PE domain-containing protein n=1 Tax=Amycolatopsis speibonae TaxID=1450224 RepID=A0ABV7NVL4_9PSEU
MAEQNTVDDFSLPGLNFFVADDLNAAGSAGGFSLSRDEMTAELENLRRLHDRIEAQRERAAPLWSIVSPGSDPASVRNTNASNTSGTSYGEHLARQSQFVATIIGKIQTALGITQQHDEQAAAEIGNVGGGHF